MALLIIRSGGRGGGGFGCFIRYVNLTPCFFLIPGGEFERQLFFFLSIMYWIL